MMNAKKPIILLVILCSLFGSCATYFYETRPLQFSPRDEKGKFEAHYWEYYIIDLKLTINNRDKEFCEAATLLQWNAISCELNRSNNPMNFTWTIRDTTSDTIIKKGIGWETNQCSAVGYQEEIWCNIGSFKAKERHNYEIILNDVTMPESGWKFNPTIAVRAATGNVWQY